MKTKIADLMKIIKLLPDEDKEGEVAADDDEDADHITPGKRKPAAESNTGKRRDNRI